MTSNIFILPKYPLAIKKSINTSVGISNCFFGFWTDGRTVAAILYVQDSYDTYDWDAEVYVNGVNKHYLNVAPDGSLTLR